MTQLSQAVRGFRFSASAAKLLLVALCVVFFIGISVAFLFDLGPKPMQNAGGTIVAPAPTFNGSNTTFIPPTGTSVYQAPINLNGSFKEPIASLNLNQLSAEWGQQFTQTGLHNWTPYELVDIDELTATIRILDGVEVEIPSDKFITGTNFVHFITTPDANIPLVDMFTEGGVPKQVTVDLILRNFDDVDFK